MKVCILQPEYSYDFKDADRCFQGFLELLDRCDDSMDIIVCPEYSDVPVSTPPKSEYDDCVARFNALAIEKARETAIRCHAIVFINAAYTTEKGHRNTTHAINREGEIVGRYFKAHPAPSEFKTEAMGGHELDCGYSYEWNEPYTLELEGIRFGFMTCYDFYFYESFAPLARKNIDIIIGCSLQRSDLHESLRIINRFLCYNTNAYLLRSSFSLGADSPVGGSSMIVAPKGDILADMVNDVGLAVCEIDPKDKYYKPAGFLGKMRSHWEYIEEGRHPQNYRQGGSSMVMTDKDMPYPRICAHRGFNTIAPENSLAAFGAAVAMGAEEIEFDLWLTKDNVLVSCHDLWLSRVSDGQGKITDFTVEELLQLDFGIKHGPEFAGMKICLFEDILKKFGGRVIMNIHMKNPDRSEETPCDFAFLIHEVQRLLRKYDCEKHAYFMCTSDEFLRLAGELAPEIGRCVGENDEHFEIVNRAIRLGAEKVQLFAPYFNEEMIALAKEHGIICNVFYTDNAETAQKYLDMGINTILTNDYHRIAAALKKV